MFDPKIIKTDYELAANQGDSSVAQRKYIIAHESGYDPDTKKPNMLLNEVQNMHNNFMTNKAYVTHFVGFMDSANEAQIYQIGEPGYVSWGALDANPYAPVQIEFARIYQNDKVKFSKAYRLYVEALRYFANLYNIPTKLDESGNGIKTHQWVTNNYGGSHIDPYGYFESMGISKAQFKHDVENGFKTEVVKESTINNVVYTLKDNVKGYTTYDSNGVANDTTNIAPDTGWISNGITVFRGQAYYAIGSNDYLPQSSTTFKGKVLINSNTPINAVNGKGETLNTKLPGGSDWKYSVLTDIPNIGWSYKIASDMYLPLKYAQGSGYKG